jgi:hypothetical protein
MSRESRPVVQTHTPTILEWLEIKSQQRAAPAPSPAPPPRDPWPYPHDRKKPLKDSQ